MDDDSGWDEILVQGWGPLVREAAVVRVERAMVGSRGMLVRVMADPDTARPTWTELLHRLVLDAIRDETGADLEMLGSQAAWACYDDTWNALARRWRHGGDLAVVPARHERAVRALLAALPPWIAERAGVDAETHPMTPLEIDGRLLVDTEGLLLAVATDAGHLRPLERSRIEQILMRVPS